MDTLPPQIASSLLWEYDLSAFARQPQLWQHMKAIVIQRIIERGWPQDWKEMLRYYGYEEVRETIKNIPLTEPRDRHFVCIFFNLQPEELWSTEKRLAMLHSI